MKNLSRTGALAGIALGAFVCSDATQAQSVSQPSSMTERPSDPAPLGGLDAIVVTANKRAQNINNVGLSVAAASSEQLQARGVVSIADLSKIVPGFTAQPSPFDTPVYTLRGVGLYESGFGSSPAVTVYVDEVALPFPLMQRGATLDVERVEVLKGPQGTLFGQNSTGGAINYIAAKPTKSLEAGARVSYERFGKVDASGYISGPLSSNMEARFAARAVSGGAWQQSMTRNDDKLGDSDELYGRLLVNWQPTNNLRLSLNVNGWTDKGDPQAPQLREISPGPSAPPAARALVAAALLPSLVISDSVQSADWTPGYPKKDDNFWQTALRADADLTDGIVLTVIGAYQNLGLNRNIEVDGAAVQNNDDTASGSVKGYGFEARLTGKLDHFDWIVGTALDRTKVKDRLQTFLSDSTYNQAVGIPFDEVRTDANQHITNKAVFANVEFEIAQGLRLLGGVRYTRSNRNGVGCTRDGDSNVGLPVAQTFEILQTVFQGFGLKTTPVRSIAEGQCIQLTPAPDLSPDLSGTSLALKEDNVSWRAGVNYSTPGRTLLYASISRGYKGGVISNVPATTAVQYQPVPQERLDAFEAGVKAPLFGREVQFNAAGFYYNYRDKQVRTIVIDPIFGKVDRLASVPKSRIWGLEAELHARPTEGLTVNLSGTYVRSRVLEPFATVPIGAQAPTDVEGSNLPYTPKWSGAADVQYEWPLSGKLVGYIGSSFTYQSQSQAGFVPSGQLIPLAHLPQKTLLDLRAGLHAADTSWRVELFGRNVTNDKNWASVFSSGDTLVRFTERPTVYGASVTWAFQ